jgi:FkbM family methyltransferase
LPVSNRDQNSIGSNAWWLIDVKGSRILDKFLLSFIRLTYLGIRVLLRIALGKKRRDILYIRKGINFKDFLYHSLSLSPIDDFMLLEFIVPRYDYEICCPINKEDLIILTRHEDDIIDHFTPKEGDIVVDIGAHMGRYTIIGSKRVGMKGKVIAIEAHSRNYGILNRNIKLNHLTNIIALNYAAYSKMTQLKLYLPDEESGYTMHHSIMFNYLSSKYALNEKDKNKFIQVRANTLDNLLQQNGISQEQVNWIKIDVEGAEYEVLKGATNILSKSKDIALLIEVHNLHSSHYQQIVDLLKFYNFKIEFEKTYENGEKHMIVRKAPHTY